MIASIRKNMAASPEYARAMPFVVFLLFTFAPMLTKAGGMIYWTYVAKTFVAVWLVWEMRKFVVEMRWAFSWEAVVVGVAVFVMWVGIDPFYPKFNFLMKDTEESIWNPFKQFGDGSALAWALIVIRIFGMTFVVPPLEEVFYRSLLYRYLIRYDFQSVAFKHFDGVAFVIASLLFASEHFQWLAGILCGFAYQLLVLRKNRLGDAMTAHAITNFLLGVYVVWKGGDAWKFF